jgi:hypothetical protein
MVSSTSEDLPFFGYLCVYMSLAWGETASLVRLFSRCALAFTILLEIECYNHGPSWPALVAICIVA